MAVIETEPRDKELVKSAQTGNMRAFEKLVERYFGIIYAVAYSRLGNREPAEDLTQEVFLRMYLCLDNLQEPYQFSGWLVRITHNLATDWERRNQRTSKLCPMVSTAEMGELIPDKRGKNAREKMNLQEQNKALHDAIFQLPADQREIVLLHFTEGLSKKEIASCLGVHPSTVGRQLKKALSRMKGSLEPILRESAPSLRATKKAVNRAIVLIGALAGMSAGGKAAIAAAAGGTAWFSSALAPAGSSVAASKVIPFVQRTIQAIANKGIKLMIAKKAIVTTLIVSGLITGGAILHVRNIQRAERSAKQEDSVPTAIKVKDERPSHPTRNDDKDTTKPEEGDWLLQRTGYSISGQVVDEAGRGIAKAEVLICLDAWFYEMTRNPEARRLKTDADGRFQARNLPKERLLITATTKDLCYYMPGVQLYDRAPCWYPVTYQPGRDSVTDVRLVLRLGAVIAGTVVDAEGEPVTNAIVTIRYVRNAQFEVAADAAGRFRAENLQPGWYSVLARAEGFASLWLDYGVKAGTEDLVVCLPRAWIVEGTVLFADTGEPVAGAKVIPRIVQSGSSRFELGGLVQGKTAETDPDGLFKVSVPPGVEAQLSASWKEYYSKAKPTVRVDAEGAAQPVTIELVKGAIVSGTVVDDETDAPVPGVRVGAYSSTSPRRVQTESDEEGRFTLAGLAEGKNWIRAYSAEYAFANPNLGEGHVIVEVVEGKDQSGIELRLAKNPAIAGTVVAGTVVDEEGEPIFGALVMLKERRDHSRGPARLGGRGISEADGTFVVRRLHGPGSTIMELLVRHPLYVNTSVSFEPDGVTNETKDVVVVLKKEGASIEGTVRDENGGPLAQAVVHLMDTPGSWSRGKLNSTATDEEGYYIFSAVADGTYWVKASLGERKVVSGEVSIVEGKTVTGVNLVFPALGRIAGRVTDDQDRPLAGFQMSVHPRGGGSISTIATDSDGRYRFDHLLEGVEYQLSVQGKPGFVRVGSHRRTVTCSADDADFTFKAIGVGTVSGFVYQESDGSPVTGFYLLIRGKEDEPSSRRPRRSFNSEDGSFSLPEVAVGLSFIVMYVGDVRKHTTEPFEVVADEEVVQIIYLPEAGTVRGSVVRASDRSPVTKFRLTLFRAEGRRWRVERPYEDKEYESEEGVFKCEGVKPNRYVIGIMAEGLPAFKSEAFEVMAGAEAVQEIVIGEGGIIRGVVVDESGHPVQDAVVEVKQNDEKVWGWKMQFHRTGRTPLAPPRAATSKTGAFELTGVTPGKVGLWVTHADYASLDVRDVAVSEEAPVEDLELKLKRGSVVFGWVKDSQGELQGNVEVRLFRLDGPAYKDTRTDHRGGYRFEHVPVGTYRLRIYYLGASLPNFEVKSGEDTEINIDLSEVGTISGTIHTPADGDKVWFRIILKGRDKAAGVSRREELRGKNAFKFEGVFPGKYSLRLDATWKNSEGRSNNPTVTTDPSKIIVEVKPKERVTLDITITKVEEREK